MKKYKRSVWLPALLFVYTTVLAVYFLPRNGEMSDEQKWGTIAASYVIIALLWFVLRKKEVFIEKKLREEEEWKRNHPFDKMGDDHKQA